MNKLSENVHWDDDETDNEEEWESLEQSLSSQQHAQEESCLPNNFLVSATTKPSRLRSLQERLSLWPTFRPRKETKKSVTWDQNKPREFSPVRYQPVDTMEFDYPSSSSTRNDDSGSSRTQCFKDMIEQEEADREDWESCSSPSKNMPKKRRWERSQSTSNTFDESGERESPKNLAKALVEEPVLLFVQFLFAELWKAPEWAHNRVALVIVTLGLLWQVSLIIGWIIWWQLFSYAGMTIIIASITFTTLIHFLPLLSECPKHEGRQWGHEAFWERIQQRVILTLLRSGNSVRQALWIGCLLAPVWIQIKYLSFMVRIQGEYATMPLATVLVATLWGCTGSFWLGHIRRWESTSTWTLRDTTICNWLCLYFSTLLCCILKRDFARLSWFLPPMVVGFGVGIHLQIFDYRDKDHRDTNISSTFSLCTQRAIELIRQELSHTLEQSQELQVQIMKLILVDSWRQPSVKKSDNQSHSSTLGQNIDSEPRTLVSSKRVSGAGAVFPGSKITCEGTPVKESDTQRDSLFWRGLCHTNLDERAQPIVDAYRRAIQEFPPNRTFAMCLSLFMQLPALIAAISSLFSRRLNSVDISIFAAFVALDALYLGRWIAWCHAMSQIREKVGDRSELYARTLQKKDFWHQDVDPMVVVILASPWTALGSIEDVPTMLRVWWNCIDSVETLESCMIAARCLQTTAITIDLKRNMHIIADFSFQVRKRGWLYGLGLLLEDFVAMLDDSYCAVGTFERDSATHRTRYVGAAASAVRNIDAIRRNTCRSEMEILLRIPEILGFGWPGATTHSQEPESLDKVLVPSHEQKSGECAPNVDHCVNKKQSFKVDDQKSSDKASSEGQDSMRIEEGTLKSDLKGDRPSKEKLILLLLCLLTFVCSLVNFLGHSKLLGLSSSSSNEGIFPRRRLHTGGDSYQGKRVLYIVTSLSEFDNGERATSKGRNRFSETLVPVVAESSSSMVIHGYEVTIFLISHYRLAKYRIAELKDNLPRGVKLIAWHDATPLGYAFDNDNVAGHLDYITRALARQHRYVIKDHLSDFDLFVCFEDDMLIKGDHLSNFQQVSQYIYDLRSNAPHSLPTDKSLFYGPMTQVMLKRMLPGFIRVEVAPSDDWQPLRKRNNPLAKSFPEIPIDYNWNSSNTRAKLDPSICCHWRGERPRVERVRFWETSIEALGVRQMPDKSWVLLQAGNNESIYPSSSVRIGEFWSGEDHEEEYFHGKLRPSRSKGDLLNNQGGWMATRRQILEWHSERCFGGFLPPYDPPAMLDDGLATATVEYWSGGIQLVGIKSCNLQRIIPLDPKRFSQSLLYHTSNNKQRQRFVLHRFSGTHIEAFWGQLNTIKKNAEQRRKVDLQKLKDSLLRKTG